MHHIGEVVSQKNSKEKQKRTSTIKTEATLLYGSILVQ